MAHAHIERCPNDGLFDHDGPRGRRVTPVRLNLGSGPVAEPGWINLDRSPNLMLDRVPGVKRTLFKAGVLREGHMTPWSRDIQVHDLTKPLPFADRSADAIYSSHALEHLYRADAQRLLCECRRVLAPGKVLRLALPDSEAFSRKMVAESTAEAALEFNRRLAVGSDTRPSKFMQVTRPLQGSHHRWQPTFALVELMLRDAGFQTVVQRAFRSGDLPGLEAIERRDESFFVEAYGPG